MHKGFEFANARSSFARGTRGSALYVSVTTLKSGLTASATRTVTEDLTAIALGSGDVPVLGTPAVLALIEQACCACMLGALPEGSTTVGTWAEVHHLAASKIGATVIATATVIEVEGRAITFTCEVTDGETLVARAQHKRAIVNREKFLSS
ncbi:MAG: hypothetical protein NVSMB57_14530 [Actinomycetota bacterium]